MGYITKEYFIEWGSNSLYCDFRSVEECGALFDSNNLDLLLLAESLVNKWTGYKRCSCTCQCYNCCQRHVIKEAMCVLYYDMVTQIPSENAISDGLIDPRYEKAINLLNSANLICDHV
jgi:hypothetical protein